MAGDLRIKICGIKTADHLAAAAKAGAAYVGFVFFAKSPRNLVVAQAADLAVQAPVGLAKVGLMVDPDDATLDEITTHVPLDMIQLHGNETPDRVTVIRQRTGLPVMKAVGIATADDLPMLDSYMQVADQILVDAKAPKGAELPGGNGLSFDWTLLARQKYWTKPWMLAGGLTPDNVAQAIRLTGATQIDVSSGVETAPGEKSCDLIRAFCKNALAG